MTKHVSSGDFRRLFLPSKSSAHKRKEQPALDVRNSYGRGDVLFLAGITHPPINEWKGWHWTKYNREKKRWAAIIAPFARSMRRVAIGERVAVEVEFRFTDRRPHDPDGYSPKFILDALVAAHVLPGDSGRTVRPLIVWCEDGAAQTATWVYLRRLPFTLLEPGGP